MWWAWLVACRGAPDLLPSETGVPEVPTPRLLAATATCDVDAGTWTVGAEADAFTGGARALFTVDGSYVENHGVLVVESAQDGTRDVLESTYPIVGDWRLANAAKTAFSCADAPSVAVLLMDRNAVVVACQVIGDPADFAEVNAAAPCRP